MNRFAIAPDFLEYCAREIDCDYFLNVLMVFAQDNHFKLCMDETGKADSVYEVIIERSECLRFWIKMLNNSPRNKEMVRIPDIEYESKESLFLAISNAIPPRKRLVTSNKALFERSQDFISSQSISLIDGDEAKGMLRLPSVTQIVTQITNGDHSPNINGNYNSL